MSEPEASDQGTIRETIAELVDRIRATTQDGAVVRRVQMLTPTGERTEPFRLSNGVALVADGEGLRTLAENTATGRRLLGEELVANFEKLVTVVGDAAERAGTPRDSAERDVRLQATQTRIGLGEHAVDTLRYLMDDANRNYRTLRDMHEPGPRGVTVVLSDEVPRTVTGSQRDRLMDANHTTWNRVNKESTAELAALRELRATHDRLSGPRPGGRGTRPSPPVSRAKRNERRKDDRLRRDGDPRRYRGYHNHGRGR